MANIDDIELLAELSHSIGLFADLAAGADPGAPVAACPGWTVADLVAHLGYIHRWSEVAVRTGERPEGAPRFDGAGAELPDWYRDAGERLLDTLASTPPGRETWTLGDPRTAGFWRRRQLHETLVHLFDLAGAARAPWAIRADVARDGIDEVLTMFYPRQLRRKLAAPLPGVLRFAPTDAAPDVSSVPAGPGAESPLGTVGGTASDLYLLLWHRLPAEHEGIDVETDPGAAGIDVRALIRDTAFTA